MHVDLHVSAAACLSEETHPSNFESTLIAGEFSCESLAETSTTQLTFKLQSDGHLRSTSRRFETAAYRETSDGSPHQDALNWVTVPLQRGRAARRGFKRFSPNKLLIEKLRRQEVLTWETWDQWRIVARSRSIRLSVMTLQYALRREARMDTSLFQMVQEPIQWKRRMNALSRRGISEEDLAHWIWILEAADADSKVDRFFSSDRHKPRFVLMAILRKDEGLIKQSSLVKIYDYVAWMCQRAHTSSPQTVSLGPRRYALSNYQDLTPKYFMSLLDRLLHHCMMRFPSSIVAISRLVVDYLRGMPENPMPNKSNRRTGYAERCRVFNFAIQRFSRTTRTLLINLPHNWKAQRILLAFSASMKRPLIINKLSYRAIRMVLIGLKKAQAEKDTAIRYSKTWPPYIRQLDGLDETKEKEEYLSRSVRAGVLKRQEGYADDLFDHTLDTLGGAVLGDSITVQTRSRAPKIWSENQRQLQIFSDWAAKVRATRNAYEAWQMFNEPPLPTLGSNFQTSATRNAHKARTGFNDAPVPRLRPNFQVYAEMFSKLYATEVDPLAGTLPGDSKEVFPPYLGNWTEFEREKLRPCSVEELYQRMLRDGNRPVRECLRVLLRNAPSLGRAATYLNDSPLDKKAIAHLTTYTDPKYERLAMIPLPVFDAYISLLCRQQGRRRWSRRTLGRPPSVQAYRKYDNLTRAIRLVSIRLGSQRKPAQEPWHAIMRAFAAEHVVLRPWATQAEDDIEGLHRMLLLFHTYEKTQTLHPFAFHCLCRCVRKTVRHANAGAVSDADHHQVITAAVDKLKTTFRELIAPVKDLSGRLKDDLPALYHEISSANISVYIDTLGQLQDFEEAARVMEWVLASYGQEGILDKARDPEHKQWQFMQQAFLCFRAFSDGNLPEAVIRKIEKRFEELHAEGCTWEWPPDDYIKDYVQEQAAWTIANK